MSATSSRKWLNWPRVREEKSVTVHGRACGARNTIRRALWQSGGDVVLVGESAEDLLPADPELREVDRFGRAGVGELAGCGAGGSLRVQIGHNASLAVVELLVLRHENQVLRRQLHGRLRWDQAGQGWRQRLSTVRAPHTSRTN
jgi:hypothetical protein